MNKIKSKMHIMLDGFAAGKNCELDWIKLDQKFLIL